MTDETKSALGSSTIIAVVFLIAVGVLQNQGIALDEKLLPPNLQQLVPALIVVISGVVAIVGRMVASKKIDRVL